jgi:hypothetical protein
MNHIAYLDAESLPKTKLIGLVGGVTFSIGKEPDLVSISRD